MKAFLMAAGIGSRISSETNNPKSLLPLKGETLLSHTVKLLLHNNIEVNIIVGYKGSAIRDELKGMDVNFYENPFYKVTNSIASFWFVKELLCDDDVLLANADVYFGQGILDILKNETQQVTMLADWSRTTEGDYFFKCDGNRLIAFGKDLDLSDRTCEYVGIAKISSSFLPQLKERLEIIIARGDINSWWEDVLYSMNEDYLINVKDAAGNFWGEVDTKEDYLRILDYISGGSRHISRLQEKTLIIPGTDFPHKILNHHNL